MNNRPITQDTSFIFKISIEKRANLEEMSIAYQKSSAQICRDLIDKEYKAWQKQKLSTVNSLQVAE